MPRENVEFKTHDDVILRGWFFKPSSASGKLPCLVMSHGWSALKEMDLDVFAEHFTTNLDITCIVFDNRGFGDSDTKEGQPRSEIIPSVQQSDISDAITYAQGRDEVDPKKIGIWGSSYSGGHVLYVAAVDKRVKAVISQAPMVDGWENFNRLVRPHFQPPMNDAFEAGMALGFGGTYACNTSPELSKMTIRSSWPSCWERCYQDPKYRRRSPEAVRTPHNRLL